MAKIRIKLSFPAGLINDPIIYNFGKTFEIVTNIKRANVEKKFGWVVLELTGTSDEIERGIAWLEEKGVRVDPVEADIVEG